MPCCFSVSTRLKIKSQLAFWKECLHWYDKVARIKQVYCDIVYEYKQLNSDESIDNCVHFNDGIQCPIFTYFLVHSLRSFHAALAIVCAHDGEENSNFANPASSKLGCRFIEKNEEEGNSIGQQRLVRCWWFYVWHWGFYLGGHWRQRIERTDQGILRMEMDMRTGDPALTTHSSSSSLIRLIYPQF